MIVTSPPDRLMSQRLQYRRPVETDLDSVATLFSDPSSNGLTGAPKTRRQSWLTMAINAGAWRMNGFGLFSIVEASSQTWLGLGGAWRPLGWPKVEITISLLEARRRRGIGTEAAVRLLDWAFDELALAEVDFLLHPQNCAGLALASKLGASAAPPWTLPMSNAAIERRRRTAENWKEHRSSIFQA